MSEFMLDDTNYFKKWYYKYLDLLERYWMRNKNEIMLVYANKSCFMEL